MPVGRKKKLHTQEICFWNQRVLGVFPRQLSDLGQAMPELWLSENYPVIVLVGGEIEKQHAQIMQQAIQTIFRIAKEMNAVIICAGTGMGIMAEVGRLYWQNIYEFPLIGVASEELAAWPGGPRSTKFLWWGKKRWSLESHYSHFIIVPGSQFGDESPWIAEAATVLSEGCKSVTILINCGEPARKDIELSLEHGRPVIALSHTGRLADGLAGQFNGHNLVSVVPAHAEQRLVKAVEAALSVTERKASGRPSLMDLLLMEAFTKVRPASEKALSPVGEHDQVLSEDIANMNQISAGNSLE